MLVSRKDSASRARREGKRERRPRGERRPGAGDTGTHAYRPSASRRTLREPWTTTRPSPTLSCRKSPSGGAARSATWPPGPGPGTTPTRKSGCRIEYLGDDDWGFALCDPATETYEPAVLPGGQLFGSAVEAYDTAAIVHLTEYAE